MKVRIETLNGNGMNTEIEISDTPIMIITKLYQEDPENAKMFFENQTAIDQLLAGNMEEARSTFGLISKGGECITAAWREPICNQPELKEALSQIEANGEVPTFTVSVAQIVG